jgi:glycosyltransferase involved in cell wall biosynthesis
MNNYLKISIVTPSFNRDKYLEETILSVVEQNYPALEYFIIDGGSSDNSKEIIRKFENKLAYWVSEPDGGMYNAIQKGFEKSTGEIMAWINSDDKYMPDAFQIVNQVFRSNSDIEWIIGMPAFYNEIGQCVKVTTQRKWSESRFWVGDYKWIQQESVFWRRSLWEKAGGYIDSSFKYAGDFELWTRFLQHAKLYPVCTPLSGFRLHGNQISLDFNEEYENEASSIIKKSKIKPSISLTILKFIWSVKKILTGTNSKLLNYCSLKLNDLADKLHQFPRSIYYDFTENKWKK